MAERLMGAALVAETDPLTDGRSRVRERGEVVLPDALLFEATEEAFGEAVLLRCVGLEMRGALQHDRVADWRLPDRRPEV